LKIFLDENYLFENDPKQKGSDDHNGENPSGVNIRKLCFVVTDDEAKYGGAFAPDKPFQPSPMFVSKAGAYHEGSTFTVYGLNYLHTVVSGYL
jgi:hypothetical protein